MGECVSQVKRDGSSSPCFPKTKSPKRALIITKYKPTEN